LPVTLTIDPVSLSPSPTRSWHFTDGHTFQIRAEYIKIVRTDGGQPSFELFDPDSARRERRRLAGCNCDLCMCDPDDGYPGGFGGRDNNNPLDYWAGGSGGGSGGAHQRSMPGGGGGMFGGLLMVPDDLFMPPRGGGGSGGGGPNWWDLCLGLNC
jgi:hypothetical protein